MLGVLIFVHHQTPSLDINRYHLNFTIVSTSQIQGTIFVHCAHEMVASLGASHLVVQQHQ